MADEQEEHQNRRARRAAARASGKPVAAATTTPKLKLAQPDYSKPKGKTLLDVYNEKSNLLSQGRPFDKKHADGLVRDEEGNVLGRIDDADLVGPAGDAVFWAVTLGMLHFTLDVLAQNQYRQDIDWSQLFKRSGSMLPVLGIVIYLLRSKTSKRWPTVRQALFAAAASVIGCYTIVVANTNSYYAVMKQLPPLGTTWIWCVIEMDILWAVPSLGVNLAFLLWKGYSVY
ncbi:hypothetical protein AMS68_000152 [Peltaster fructicola]|uniref:DUF7719 domain-containing protein n=1 Tax=Peltaster fructicola TaxID=286661 RepID=A0A6H0XJ31_9PEZI|nr:hypothetical protein AMS68_000152 [Peltaster fructicola]